MPFNQTRDTSATRIAVTLGALVATVMLGIWGATAVAGALHGQAPAPKATPIAKTKPVQAGTATTAVTATAEATAVAEGDRTQVPVTAPVKPVPVKPAPAPKPAPKYVVVIDPGHGGELSGSEPTGPNDSTPHPRTASGATGVNGKTEAELVLKIGLKLRPMLEARGVKVIMVRTTPARISNIQRAEIANKAKADLFLRLHMDGADGSSAHGISMQVPAAGWPPIAESRKAGEIILKSLISETGAANRGIAPRKDLAGFNWCKVPTALPELGFLSNRAEADKLASDAYQQKLAQALADGTMRYLATVR